MAEAHLLTHWPKNPHCQSCQIAKAQRRLARRRLGQGPRPDSFCDLFCGHIVATSLESQGLVAEGDGLAIMG